MNAKEFMAGMASGELQKTMKSHGTRCTGCGKPLSGEDPGEVYPVHINRWPIWQIVEIGIPELRTEEDFTSALARMQIAGNQYVDLAIKAMIPGLITRRTVIKLVRVTVSGLGLPDLTHQGDFFDAAQKAGLLIDLPFEVGIFLRLKYTDQPPEERLHVAVKPLSIQGMKMCGIFMYKDHISGDNLDLGISLAPEYNCVFGLP